MNNETTLGTAARNVARVAQAREACENAKATEDRMTNTAGEATRMNAATTLRMQARNLRGFAAAKLHEARMAIEKTRDAERMLEKAHALEVLADEAAHLRGPAEQALWELALQRETNGV